MNLKHPMNRKEFLLGSTVLQSPPAGRWYMHLWLRELGAELMRHVNEKTATVEWMGRFVPWYNNLSRSLGLRGLLDKMIEPTPDGGWKIV